MVTDEKYKGRAILQGNLLGAAFDATGSLTLEANKELCDDGHNWYAKVRLQLGVRPELISIAQVFGRHVVAPDPGEGCPGPPLNLGDPTEGFFYSDLDDKLGLKHKKPLSQAVQHLHDNPTHWDMMTATLSDLDPASGSVLFGAGKEIRLVIDLHHTPEPSTLLLLGSGLLGIGRVVASRKKRSSA